MHLSNSALIPLLLATTASYAQAQSQNTITAVTGCHFHGTAYFCMHDGKEGSVSPAPTATQNAPTQYTACHNHGTQLYCMNGGAEVMYVQPTASADDHGHEEEHSHEEGEEGHDHDHITSSPSGTAASAAAQTTAVTACHFHATDYFCVDGNGVEGSIKPPPSQTENAPAQYTGCHNHGTQKFCMDGSEEVMFVAEGGAESGHGEGEHSHDGEEVAGEDGVSCHYHAGVRHCVDAQGNTVEQPCIAEGIKEPNYRLKVGLLFAILASSTFAVYIPIFIRKYSNFSLDHIVFILMRQFGTGVVISTALIHLLTHANLMLTNKCVGGLSYESTTTAIVMAGAFLAFLIEYTFNRLLKKRQAAIKNKQEHIDSDSNNDEKLQVSGQSTGCEPGIVTEQSDAHAGHIHEHGLIDPQDKLSVMIMEAGIVFHSILIGLTLSVTPDDGVITLFIVIVSEILSKKNCFLLYLFY